MLKKILLGSIALLALAFIALQIYINTGNIIELPPNTDEIITQTLKEGVSVELIKGKTGYVQNGDIKIWYEVINEVDTPKATVLLIMGHSGSALLWTAEFYEPLVNAGYQVIRFDNRGLGNSSWVDDWTKATAYSLEEMAGDAIAILDKVGVEKAHIIGVSMGGMIAQRLAISHSERVASLTSIMSTGYWEDSNIPQPNAFISKVIKLALKHHVFFNPSEANQLTFRIGIHQALKGDGDYGFDIKEVAQRSLYEIKKRRGFNTKVGDQHTAAIAKSGSRLEELSSITVPTLIIHGKSDPLIDFAHCEKYASLIPHASKLFIDDMGHTLPSKYMGQLHEAIFRKLKEGG